VAFEDDVLRIEPLLDRIERLESRGSGPDPARLIGALNGRIEQQETEIRDLRNRLNDVESGIERTVETRVGERVAAIERSIAEQSVSLAALRDHAFETDTNLQKLIAAIDRLCEQKTASAAATTESPFETQLAEAARRVGGDEERVKTRRLPFTRILGVFVAALLPRLMQ
jgi:uncharacterized coiled-coil protein SlyX